MMVNFIQVNYGTTAVLPEARTLNNGAIIGKVSTQPTENPFYVRTQTELDSYLTDTSSALYKSVVDFLANKGSTNAGVWCYALSGSTETIEDLGLEGLKNASNLTFKCPYVPLTSIANVEINYSNSGWVSVAEGTYWQSGLGSDGSLNGAINFAAATGFYYSGADQGAFSGLFVFDGIRADVGIGAMSRAYNALLDKDWYIMSFAYDQNLAQPLDPNVSGSYKYASGQCYSDADWLRDIRLGASMATSYQGASHACVFYGALPDGVRTTTKMSGYASGYLTTKYPDLKSLIGANPYLTISQGNQTTDGVSMDNMAFSVSLREHPRNNLMYKSATTSTQTVYPQRNEVSTWRASKINPYIERDNGPSEKIPCFGNGNTFGNGNEGNLNFVRCRDIIRAALMDDLQALIANSNLHYNIAGINAIESQIRATMNQLVADKYCDGFVSVTIPIKSYLANEDSLDTGQALILARARATKIVDNVAVKFKWESDIEGLVINPLEVA